jgi:diguanylate cyclase (GGDEF)-like protein
MAATERRLGGDRRASPGGNSVPEDLEVATALRQAQTIADLDQREADSDQDASDADQRGSHADQVLANRDQFASDRDQAAADYYRTHLPESPASDQVHRTSTRQRDLATSERGVTAAARAQVTGERLATSAHRNGQAGHRDRAADSRDRAADARDLIAESRDSAAEAAERHALASGTDAELIGVFHALRVAGASVRMESANDRRSASAERKASASERGHAAEDRRDAGLDELTGVFRRGPGELALTQEIARAHRDRRPLVLALINVDGLKSFNASHGYESGDSLLQVVSHAITSTMRASDVVMRWEGDEFVSTLIDATLEAAADRVRALQEGLNGFKPRASISVGLTELEADDVPETLIARARVALCWNRAEPTGATQDAR